MKILVAGPQFPDSFAQNIAVTLVRMGFEVTRVEGTRAHHHGKGFPKLLWTYMPKAFPAFERVSCNQIVRTAEKVQPDLVLITYGSMPPAVVGNLKKVSAAKVVCWFTDTVINLPRQYLLACPYDAVFLKDPFLVRAFREKLGMNAHYLPECCNPMWHQPTHLTDQEIAKYGCDLAAAGTLHYYRARMLEGFDGYDLKVWGRNAPAWIETLVRTKYMNHYVSCHEKAKAYAGAKILLNTMFYAEVEGVNCTLFEAAGCGAFQIADWKPALPDLFEPEHEIVTFRTRQELKEKVDYYLAHPAERQEIADRAYGRAHRDHTYEKRLEKMFAILGVGAEPLVQPVHSAA